MKIYKEIKINLKTGATISEKSFEYSGDISNCGGGGGGDSYDSAYNSRMADIAERTAKMSEEAFQSWAAGGGRALEEAQYAQTRKLLPFETEAERATLEANTGLIPIRAGLEKEQIGATSALLPAQTALQQKQIGAESSLLPSRTAYEKSGLDYGTKQTGFKSDLMNKFYASLGKNSEASAVRGARADVAGAVSQAKSSSIRDQQRRGVTRPSGGYGLEGAKLQVGAMNTAREGARKRNLEEYTRGLTI